MKSPAPGTSTSVAEVSNVSPHGIWVIAENTEYFLPYDEYPWFRDAKVSDIFKLECPRPGHLHWPRLDVDLTLDSLEHPERYPLIASH